MANVDEMEVLRRFKGRQPVDVVGAIRALGIRYVEKSMAAGQSGYFANTGRGYEIGVNIRDGAQRRRFTAAHELGHFIMHRDLLGPGQHLDRLFGDYVQDNPNAPFSPAHEVQANQFAADFLMPANVVANMYRRMPDIQAIADRFSVSRAATEIRLKNLGLIN